MKSRDGICSKVTVFGNTSCDAFITDLQSKCRGTIKQNRT